MVMVANKKSQDQMTEDLSLFLGNNTIRFTVWYVSEYLCLGAKLELVFCIGGVLRNLVRFTVERHSVGCAAQTSGGFSICQWEIVSHLLSVFVRITLLVHQSVYRYACTEGALDVCLWVCMSW